MKKGQKLEDVRVHIPLSFEDAVKGFAKVKPTAEMPRKVKRTAKKRAK